MPFGQDDNDLPLEHFQKAFKSGLVCLMRGCQSLRQFDLQQEMNLSLLQLMHEHGAQYHGFIECSGKGVV